MYNKSLCLRIIGIGSKHEAISKILNTSPTHTCLKEDPLPEWSASLREPPSKGDVWILNSPLPEDADFEKHVEYFSTLLGPAEEAIMQLKYEGARIDVFCTLSTDQKVIHLGVPAETMGVLSRLGVRISIFIANFAVPAKQTP